MNKENQPLVINEPVEFEKYTVEVQDFKNIPERSRGIHEIYLKLMKINQIITTWNRLDLETLGFGLIVPENLPDIVTNISFQGMPSKVYEIMPSFHGHPINTIVVVGPITHTSFMIVREAGGGPNSLKTRP